MRKFLFSFVLSTLLLAGNGWGATYYVNQTGGSDANNGLSTGSAWRTIAKVNASSYVPGDFILFKKGETWREKLGFSSNGNINNSITLGVYGTGSEPIISGSDLVTGWLDYGSNRWSATLISSPRQVFFDGTRGTSVGSAALVNSSNKWYWGSNVLYVYSVTNPTTAYTNPGIEAAIRDYTIVLGNKQYITIDGLHLTKTWESAVYAFATGTNSIVGIKIINSTLDYNYWDGFTLETGTGRTTDNVVMRNCVASYNGRNGFLGVNLNTGPNRITIDNNTFAYNGQINDTYSVGVYNNVAGHTSTKVTFSNNNVYGNRKGSVEGTGIQFDDRVDDNIAEYNYVHDNEGGGIHAGNAGNNNIVRYNLIMNNATYGIYGRIGDNVAIYNNTIYGTSGGGGYSGINFESVTNYYVKNNIVYGNFPYAMRVVATGGMITCTNNLMFGYTTVATSSITCTSSVTSNPLFVSNTSNWSLQAGSPAINAGVDVGLTRAYLGNTIVGLPEIGAYEYNFTPLKKPSPPKFLTIPF